MLKKKTFCILLILFILFAKFSYATDINTNSENIDNTTYISQEELQNNEVINDVDSENDYQPATIGIDDAQDSAELSISNIINIILIAIGIVLILLGIAILIKLK